MCSYMYIKIYIYIYTYIHIYIYILYISYPKYPNDVCSLGVLFPTDLLEFEGLSVKETNLRPHTTDFNPPNGGEL